MSENLIPQIVYKALEPFAKLADRHAKTHGHRGGKDVFTKFEMPGFQNVIITYDDVENCAVALNTIRNVSGT